MRIRIKGRAAFLSLWSPSSVNGGAEKYRARIIVDPKDKPSVKAIDDAYLHVATEKWGAKGKGILAATANDKNKGSWFKADYIDANTGEAYDGFEDMYHLSVLSDKQPTILDRDRTELTKRDGRPYPGCHCVWIIDVWAQDNSNGKAVRSEIVGVQFVKDGDSFGGGGKKADVDEFEDLSDLGDEDEQEEAPKPKPKGAKPKAKPVAEEDEDDIG